MRIRGAPAAADDLEQIGKYLQEKNRALAHSTVKKLYDAAQSLKRFANVDALGG
jgi:plasmid stabilization system protein ParE